MVYNPQNFANHTLPPPSSTTRDVASTLYESEESPKFDEPGAFSKVLDGYEIRINAMMIEIAQYQNENALLKDEKKKLLDEKQNVLGLDETTKKALEDELAYKDELNQELLDKIYSLEKQLTVSLDDDSKKAYEDEINRLKHITSELEATKAKHADSKKALDQENARLVQVNAELQATNEKQGEKISALQQQHEHGQKEKNSLKITIAGLQTTNVKQSEKISVLEKQHEDGQKEKDALKSTIVGLQTTCEKQAETISGLEKQHERDQKEMNALENTIAEMKTLKPLVIKKLLNCGMDSVWHLYSNESDEALNISMKGSNFFTYEVFQKNLLLQGVISQFQGEPFNGPAYVQSVQPMMVQNLLERVVSCNVTDLYLHDQTLTWSAYEKLVSSGRVQNLYFLDVQILTVGSDNFYAPLEHILQKLSNVRNFAHSACYVTKETFKSLIKFPVFEHLQQCHLNVFNYQDFDANGFLDFIKRYHDTHFKLAFQECNSMDCGKLQTLKEMLHSRSTPDQLEIAN